MTDAIPSPEGVSAAGHADPHVEPSLKELAVTIGRQWRLLAACALAGAALGAASGLLSTRQYTSTATFIPQSTNDVGAGGLALAASQFGIRVPSGGTTWTAPVYVDLLTSRRLLTTIAAETLQVAELQNERRTLPVLLKLQKMPERERTERTVRALRRHISASEIKKLGAVSLTVTTPWASVSYALAERLLSEVNRFNVYTRQSQARAERAFMETQLKLAEQALRDAEVSLQQFRLRNRTIGPDLELDRDRRQREVTMRQQAYASLLQSFTEARLREIRDTPVITILEAPVLPALGESRQTVVRTLLGFTVGALLSLIAVLARGGWTRPTGGDHAQGPPAVR